MAAAILRIESGTPSDWKHSLPAKDASLNRAVLFVLLTRGWQALAGGITLLFIARFFTPEVQGYYYTFASLVALQTFAELGLSVVVLIRASHEWSSLQLGSSGEVTGDPAALARLSSLMRFVAMWYAAASLVFLVGAGIGGYLFLARSPAPGVEWIGPWWATVALAAVQLWAMPFLSLLEGCSQVAAVNRFRLVQTVAEALTMWALFLAGAGLWVAAASVAVKVAATLFFLAVPYQRFFASLVAAAGQERVSWRTEIWPMQWRLAAQAATNYLAFSLFTPVMFHYYGPKAAGQIGMTLQIISVVQLMGLAWVQTRVPLFGMLAAKREYDALDSTWRRATRFSLGFTAVGGLTMWLAIVALHEAGWAFADRILEPLPSALFILAFGVWQITHCQAAYLRAHGREPFLAVGVLGSTLIGALVLVLGASFGPLGEAIALLAAIALFIVPASTYVWQRRRAEWQAA
jgi:O-antigen/teichoic acid export membrane protein